MKIDTDLRLAIKSAERAQPQNRYNEVANEENQAIVDFLKSHPAKAKAIRAHIAKVAALENQQKSIEKELCEKFGLRISEYHDHKLAFAGCGNGRERFVKAGGRPKPARYERWKFNDVMKKLAAATPQEGAKIIKALGINWE